MAITIATYGIYDMIFDLKFISAHVWDKTVDTTEILHATLDNITKGGMLGQTSPSLLPLPIS